MKTMTCKQMGGPCDAAFVGKARMTSSRRMTSI